MMVNSRNRNTDIHQDESRWHVQFVVILYVDPVLKHKFGSGSTYFVTVCKIPCDQNIILHLLYIIWHPLLVGQIHSFVHSTGYGKLTWTLVLKYFRLQSARPDIIEKRWGCRPVWSALVVSPANAVNSSAVDPPSSILMTESQYQKTEFNYLTKSKQGACIPKNLDPPRVSNFSPHVCVL